MKVTLGLINYSDCVDIKCYLETGLCPCFLVSNSAVCLSFRDSVHVNLHLSYLRGEVIYSVKIYLYILG